MLRVHNNFLNILEDWILYLLITSIFLIPQIEISNNLPLIHITDILIPFIGIFLLKRKFDTTSFNEYLKLISVFSIYIFFSIFVNNRLGSYRDYFEILKLIKFSMIFVFVSISIQRINFSKFLFFLMACVFLFNFLQFTNLFNFHYIVERYYATELQFSGFGVNSLGLPDTKRMLGTMGNPNNNAILFLFLSILKMPNKFTNARDKFIFILIFIGLVACQSRTGIIAFVIIFGLNIYFKKLTLTNSMNFFIFIIIGIYVSFSYFQDTSYTSSVINSKIIETRSVQGRFEIWSHLWQMIKQKPIFGHGPYKEYFYENNLYSENEYILMIWRYGLIGLIFYIGLITYPAIHALKNKTKKYSVPLILFCAVISITALTNNPISEPRILVMFAIITGLYYSEIINKTNTNEKAINRW